MLAAERQRIIAEMVHTAQSVSVADMVERLGVSIETVRRDLERLDRAGVLKRVRGGAVRAGTTENPIEEPSFPARKHLAAPEKRALSQRAPELIGDAKIIFVDLGTTALALAGVLAPVFTGTVVTPSMRVAKVFCKHPNITVLMPGGIVRGGDIFVSGSTARSFLSEIYPDIAFIGTGGLDREAGVTDFDFDQADIKKLMIHNSTRTYALVDSSKFGVRAPFRVCSAHAIDAILTDEGLSRAEQQAWGALEVELLIGALQGDHRGGLRAAETGATATPSSPQSTFDAEESHGNSGN